MKILAVDVGNTSAFFTYCDNGKFKKGFRLATRTITKISPKALGKKLPLQEIEAALIASVVPPAGEWLKRTISQKLKVKALLVGKDFEAPIINAYKHPKQVGIDRLMNAVAVFSRFGTDAIVIDFGTAITFDIVSRKGVYLGGVIAPGIEISLEALYRNTALLPRIRLAHPKNIIGQNTVESIRAGCSFGIGGLCDRVVEEIIKQHKLKPAVVGTGGYAPFMRRYCARIDSIDELLTVKGIYLSYLSYKKILTKHLI
ncbi:MAG: pantothenate kinase [Candidatus Omnitrophica bacterium CG07_land_8_20_14_0_80_50_8]|nr:MAG: hypothetical protein AUJ71_01695 [Candidatus Omnitrophica bacterium CG1_02_49_16]PIU39992.1 MAG: pantothenate kinase [Candidatus Omnitrophica bacterium CG07_land_8_20_14_0_80_50_8]